MSDDYQAMAGRLAWAAMDVTLAWDSWVAEHDIRTFGADLRREMKGLATLLAEREVKALLAGAGRQG